MQRGGISSEFWHLGLLLDRSSLGRTEGSHSALSSSSTAPSPAILLLSKVFSSPHSVHLGAKSANQEMVDSYTIQISSNLIDRLAGGQNKAKKRTKKPKPRIPKEPYQPENNVKLPPSSQQSVPSGVWPLQPPVFLPIPPPPPVTNSELEAIRSVLQESERTLEKLEKQEGKMTQELNQRAKELRDKEFKLPYQSPNPCTVERDSCLKCYKENARDPLKCAQVVKNFAECARQARLQGSFKVKE